MRAVDRRKNRSGALASLVVDNVKKRLSTIASALHFWNNEVLMETETVAKAI